MAEGVAQPRRRGTPTRIFLGILTTLVTLNLWTGGPLFAVWVGSRVQAAIGQLSMSAIAATIGTLIVVTYVLYRALTFLSQRYDDAIGRQVPRRQDAWLKPMSGERRAVQVKRPLTAVERIVITMVVVACEAFVVWFFFFAHYSLPGG